MVPNILIYYLLCPEYSLDHASCRVSKQQTSIGSVTKNTVNYLHLQSIQ